ncbi:MAG TPA: hypothetical protein DCS07_03420 [Bdellovibrionales bacterium]|nr:MAG: hypothetical protein A2X97_10330 [Bdellovibrionales bacterium GWA1_52_35]OFZ39261.1 MAG: hypothetical protein A2070_13205 [Bdellovibrionales bacterium GWC1_52_8]HAR41668.1 hypothetical protein [Bdellovibrionales bacterium]HCM38689.1 hypothetical protein [Bdellovibrionales bacterium]
MLPYPVVEIKGTQPIGNDFDLYGYVDVDHQSWLGTSAIFGSNFHSINQVPRELTKEDIKDLMR